jgi:hypothetical protein
MMWLLLIAVSLPIGMVINALELRPLSQLLGSAVGLPLTVVATLLASLSAEGWRASFWQVARRLDWATIGALWGIGWRAGIALLGLLILGAGLALISSWLAAAVAGIMVALGLVLIGVATVVVVLEDEYPGEALKRAWLIIRRQIVVAFLVGVCLTPSNALSIASAALPSEKAGIIGLIALLMAPFEFVGPVVVYFNVRCRFEAYHLETLREGA